MGETTVYSLQQLRAMSRSRPIGWLKDIQAAALPTILKQFVILRKEDADAIEARYKGFVVSEADRFDPNELISGCCDRADQY